MFSYSILLYFPIQFNIMFGFIFLQIPSILFFFFYNIIILFFDNSFLPELASINLYLIIIIHYFALLDFDKIKISLIFNLYYIIYEVIISLYYIFVYNEANYNIYRLR